MFYQGGRVWGGLVCGGARRRPAACAPPIWPAGCSFALGIGLFGRVIQHVLRGSATVASAMMGISLLLALVANLNCAGPSSPATAMAAQGFAIFTANDALANVGVIVTGLLVAGSVIRGPTG